MAVDAQHLNNNNNNFLPHQQLFTEIDMQGLMMYNNNQHISAPYGGAFPVSGTTTVESSLLPAYASSPVMPAANNQAPMKDVSGRKRGRDHSGSTINQQSFARHNLINELSNGVGSYSFLGEDVSVHFLQQQLDIDRFIYQHMEKVRVEIEERRKRNSRRMIEVVEEGLLKRLKAKEDEIEKIGRLNWTLEERVGSLSVETQTWRGLAQTNEATANALRTNLEQVLAKVAAVRQPQTAAAAAAAPISNLDEAESCCGSSTPDNHYLKYGGEEDEEGWRTVPRKGEACVVMLTCLCAGCGSTRNTTTTCPVCNLVNDATPAR